jgi:flagellar biosynthesis protein FlhF
MLVMLPPDAKTGASASAAPLRCVIRRVADADSGRPITHSYLVASDAIDATAQQMSHWPAWRAAAEPYFKLLGEAQAQLSDGASADETACLQQAWVAGQVCTTVLRLQQSTQPWAQAARLMLTQLAGHAVRPGRPVSGPVLLEGLDKFLVLLEALETDVAATLPRPLQAAAHN